MAPKTNAKKEAGRAKKAENETKKKGAAAAEQDKKESEEWEKGAKSSKAKEEKEEKKRAEAARKAEIARLLAEEEASLPSKPKAAPKAGAKKEKPPAGPGALATGGLKLGDEKPSSAKKEKQAPEMDDVIEVFSATGIDDALDLLTTITAKTDKASVGAAAGQLEKHPERRFKAAYLAYEERELPRLKEERPGMRLQQYKDLVFKQFQKSPENPFNQVTLDYNATKEEKVGALGKQRREVEQRLRE